MASNRQWEPVEGPRGRYCSPACGAGCKKAAHTKAVRAAAGLAQELGPGWKPVVFENLGWHYRAEKGVMHVVPLVKGSAVSGKYGVHYYTAFFNAKTQLVGNGTTPRKAMEDALQQARALLREMSQQVAIIVNPPKEAE